MKMTPIGAKSAPQASGGYSQAIEVVGIKRQLFISGQIPIDADDNVPNNFDDQARLVWKNIEAQLKSAGMGLQNIVKHTTFLSDRKYRSENSRVRQEVLGKHAPALTVIIADIYDEDWFLEIEAIAMD
ncbi:MAG: RidA family protein [Rhizobiaceae bacterium]|nr:RidA family protein [Rhizobiaceae bacterium]MBL4695493.1 RidA family protein [Rhizobiaceae bacterium]MBL4731574.1 RidA family protein [Rhizobiaceae bacterium]